MNNNQSITPKKHTMQKSLKYANATSNKTTTITNSKKEDISMNNKSTSNKTATITNSKKEDMSMNNKSTTNNRYDARILGVDAFSSNNSYKTGLNNNVLVLGTSGCGKSGSYLYSNLKLLNNQSAVICDSKGLLHGKFKDELESKGYTVWNINLTNPEVSENGWNPLDYLYKKNNEISQLSILKMCQALIPENTKTQEPIWTQGAQGIWHFLTTYCLEAFPREDHTMRNIVKLYRKYADSSKTIEFDKWVVAHPKSYAASKFREIQNNRTAEKMFASYLGFINAMVNFISLPELNNIFENDNPIDLNQISKRKTALFVQVPDIDHSMDTITNLLYSQIIQTLISQADSTSEGRLDIPVTLYLDDFGNTCIPNFDKIISVTRSRDIGISIMLQSISQLVSAYGNEAGDTILNNMDSIIYMGNNDYHTSEFIATRVGKTTTSVMYMPRDKEFLIVSGQPGKLTDKLKPYSDNFDPASIIERESNENANFQF